MKAKIPLHIRIFIGMLVGVVGGMVLRWIGLEEESKANILAVAKVVGDLFMRMIFMMVIPLLLSALTLGIAEFGDLGKLGKIGWRMFKYTLVVSGISVLIGVGLTNAFKPGEKIKEADRVELMKQFSGDIAKLQKNADEGKAKSFGSIITDIIPKNPVEDMARAFDPTYRGGGLLAIMFFSLFMGIAMSTSPPEKVAGLRSALEGLYEVTMKIIGYGMRLAPLGVAALLLQLTLNTGLGVLQTLLGYMLLVIGALAIHQFVTFSIIIRMAGMPLRFFYRGIREVMLTAFSTSSSNATLPVAIKAAIEKLKLPKDISHFVLTIGSTANQNGTALYEGITVLFLAQVFNVPLEFHEQMMVVLVSILAGMGTAGVPGGSLPVIMIILDSIGVPGASIGLIIGVDRILDMSRTVLNVTGDVTATVYIAHKEGRLIELVEEEAQPQP